MHFYNAKEIEYLRKIAIGRTNKEITKMFNKKFNLKLSETAISGTRKRYNIKNGLDGRFKKGHKTWNKGMKGLSTGGKETQFKKGNLPLNYMPVGSERVNGDDYVDIKIADPNKWKGKHILIWEKNNGPVPKNYAIIFGDGDNRNFNIENLICVSRQQLLYLNRNRLIKNDVELTRTGIILADLNKKISEIKAK